MEGREGCGGGRVTSKAKGTGGGHGNRKSRLGLLPKDLSQPGPSQGETPAMKKEHVGRTVGLRKGAWTRWESMVQCKAT